MRSVGCGLAYMFTYWWYVGVLDGGLVINGLVSVREPMFGTYQLAR